MRISDVHRSSKKTTFATKNEEAPVGKIRPAVVAVTAYNGKGEVIDQGSGFFISREGRLITYRHVLKGASRVEVRTREGKVYPVKIVIAEDSDLDLIQLLIDIKEPDCMIRNCPHDKAKNRKI